MSNYNISKGFIIVRKGKKIRDEKIYNEGQFVRILLIEFNNKIYWIKKINGIVKDFLEVDPNAKEIRMD